MLEKAEVFHIGQYDSWLNLCIRSDERKHLEKKRERVFIELQIHLFSIAIALVRS